jgi:predicted RNA binding protein YcfA (HicA-like mRNA interferase family)
MASELRFADVLRRLQSNGWQLDRVAGSHHIFVKKGKPLLSIPVKQNKVKPCYAKKIDQACDGS